MLEDKRILVVGAGGCIGRSLVEFLNEKNIDLIAVDSSESSLEYIEGLNEKRTTSPIQTRCIDILKENELDGLKQYSERLDGLVNCAYPKGANYGRNFLEQSVSDFNDNVNRHLGSAFALMQACAKAFKRDAKPFSLVNLSSIYGVVAPRFQLYEGTTMTMPVEYAAIKSAIIHLTKYFAKAMASSDFRVNCVSPGGILDKQDDSFVYSYKKQCIENGMLDARDVCGTIAFLLSDHSAAINGQNILVDDGFTL